jgi:hypothetical protein
MEVSLDGSPKETVVTYSGSRPQGDLSHTVAKATPLPSELKREVMFSAINHEPRPKTPSVAENFVGNRASSVANGEATPLTQGDLSHTVAKATPLPSELKREEVFSAINHEPRPKTPSVAENFVGNKASSVANEEALENAKGVIKLHEVQDRGSTIQPSLRQEMTVPLVASSVSEQILANTERVSEPVPASQVQARQTIVEIGNIIAQRILVHEATKAESEIFIQLRESVLPGTGVSLFKNGTSLRVDFLSKMGNSVAFLSQHHVALQEYLTQRLENVKEVRVSVYDHSEKDWNQSSERDRHHRREKEGSFQS